MQQKQNAPTEEFIPNKAFFKINIKSAINEKNRLGSP